MTEALATAACSGSGCAKSEQSQTIPDSSDTGYFHGDCVNEADLKVLNGATSTIIGMATCRVLQETWSQANTNTDATVTVGMAWTSEIKCGTITSGPMKHTKDMDTNG